MSELASMPFNCKPKANGTPHLDDMLREIVAILLTESTYTPSYGLIAANLVTRRTVINNGGTSRKSLEVVPTENLYAAAPSGQPGKAIVNVSIYSP
jgi:hypothetical protein